MRVNFDYMSKYPHYIFNWSGSNRYRLMQEYYPADYARLKGYVATGQWFPAGSSVEEGDVNLPSAESIFRQVLYGNTFFRAEFGKASAEYMLPEERKATRASSPMTMRSAIQMRWGWRSG